MHPNKAVMEALVDGSPIVLLQTDFCKAYDFINREALILALEGLNIPSHFLNLAKNIMVDTPITMPPIAGGGTIMGKTGVKQGCPISPLLFIIIFDLLVNELETIPGVCDLSGYMDDLAAILANGSCLAHLSEIFFNVTVAQLEPS